MKQWLVAFSLVLAFAVPIARLVSGAADVIVLSAPDERVEVRTWGALRAIHHEGDTGAKVSLAELLPDADLYAVGALEGLSGEVTIVAGQAFLSLPFGETARTEMPAETDAAATLLVAARVSEWQSATIKTPIPFDRIDREIAAFAKELGFGPDERFPFLIVGEVEDLRWHVIDGSRLPEGDTTHEDHLKTAARMQMDRATATLVGFFSTGDQGVFTHMDSRTHMHCVIEEPLAAGHVDHVIIPAGAIIRFPAPGEREDP